jgi:hypothetical protein
MSYAVGFWVLAVVFGVLLLVLSPIVLTSPSDPSHVSGGISFLIGGLGLIAQGLLFLLFTARRVASYPDGDFVFSSWRRTLSIAAGQLQSIRCIWIDPNRLAPMRVRSAKGSILVFPRIPAAEDLFSAIQQANPEATITTPTPITSRNLRPS